MAEDDICAEVEGYCRSLTHPDRPEVAALLAGEQGAASVAARFQPRWRWARPAAAVAAVTATALLVGAAVAAGAAASGVAGPRSAAQLAHVEQKDEYSAQPATATGGQQPSAYEGFANTGQDAYSQGANVGQQAGWDQQAADSAYGAPTPNSANYAPSAGAAWAPSAGSQQAASAWTPWPTPAPYTPYPTPGTPAPLPCGWQEENTYYPGNELESMFNVITPDDCCDNCAKNTSCYAWSYKKSTQECILKGNKPLEALTKLSDPEYTSGQATQVREAIPLTVPQPGQATMYCWALMIPGSIEPALLLWEFNSQVSLFRCDEYGIFSNLTLTVAPGLVTQTVASDLHCEKGGEFGTALNTEIFIAAWTAVVGAGRFKFHDWTIKVDPDSVFFPARLRTILSPYAEEAQTAPNGVYLNNCHRGMHGPIEVLSRKAVETWFGGITKCQEHFVQLCSGDCQWGEDLFMDQCLMKVLDVTRKNNSKVLLEEACDPPENWNQCKNDQIAAYHPFKEPATYKNCLQNSGVTLPPGA